MPHGNKFENMGPWGLNILMICKLLIIIINNHAFVKYIIVFLYFYKTIFKDYYS